MTNTPATYVARLCDADGLLKVCVPPPLQRDVVSSFAVLFYVVAYWRTNPLNFSACCCFQPKPNRPQYVVLTVRRYQTDDGTVEVPICSCESDRGNTLKHLAKRVSQTTKGAPVEVARTHVGSGNLCDKQLERPPRTKLNDERHVLWHPSVNLFADFLDLFPPCIHAQALTLIRQSDRTILPIDDSEVLGFV